MSAIRKATPFIVAAMTGVLSGFYIFKPMFVNGTHDLSVVPGQDIATSSRPESQLVTNNKETK